MVAKTTPNLSDPSNIVPALSMPARSNVAAAGLDSFSTDEVSSLLVSQDIANYSSASSLFMVRGLKIPGNVGDSRAVLQVLEQALDRLVAKNESLEDVAASVRKRAVLGSAQEGYRRIVEIEKNISALSLQREALVSHQSSVAENLASELVRENDLRVQEENLQQNIMSLSLVPDGLDAEGHSAVQLELAEAQEMLEIVQLSLGQVAGNIVSLEGEFSGLGSEISQIEAEVSVEKERLSEIPGSSHVLFGAALELSNIDKEIKNKINESAFDGLSSEVHEQDSSSEEVFLFNTADLLNRKNIDDFVVEGKKEELLIASNILTDFVQHLFNVLMEQKNVAELESEALTRISIKGSRMQLSL